MAVFRDLVERAALEMIDGMLRYTSADQVREDLIPQYVEVDDSFRRDTERGYDTARAMGIERGRGLVGGQVPDALQHAMQTPLWETAEANADKHKAAWLLAELVVAYSFNLFEIHIGPTARDALGIEDTARRMADSITKQTNLA